MNYWNIKAIYPMGGHYATANDGSKLRFAYELDALNEAERLNSIEKMNAARNMRKADVNYIVVKES